MTGKDVAFAASLWLLVGGNPLQAAEDLRMLVDGSKIIFNGDLPPANGDDGFAVDYPHLLDLAAANPDVSTIVLTGSFPGTGYAIDVARGIEGLGLATEIVGECTDACVYMFVAGKQRTLSNGAKLGLRRMTIKASRLRERFEKDQAAYGWQDEFGQAAMVYDMGQSSMHMALQYLTDHGVSTDFALRIFATPREDLWWPSREELVQSGTVDR
jgi:hypothetical protein